MIVDGWQTMELPHRNATSALIPLPQEHLLCLFTFQSLSTNVHLLDGFLNVCREVMFFLAYAVDYTP